MDKILYQNQLEYLSQFKKQTNKLIQEMEVFAKENRVPILDWKSAEFLDQLIIINKPKKILEIGMAIAYSTIRMALNDCVKKVVAIEVSEENIKLAEKNINKSKVKNKIEIRKGDALKLLIIKEKFDLIFLDADKEDYSVLLNLSLPLLKRNGIIFIDNLLWHGFTASKRIPKKYKRSTKLIREFNIEFMNHPGLNSSILTIGDGIGLGIKKDLT